jgi:Na+/melibiose symporter-like transporter
MRGNAAGWGSAEVIGTLAAGIVLLAAFVAFERRTAEPMLPPRLFKSRAFSAGAGANFLLSCALFSAVFFMAQFQQVSLGQGPLDSGLRLLPWTATLFVVAPLAGSLVNRIGERPLVVTGLLLQAAGMAWIALIAKPGLAFWETIPPLVIAGAGISMAIPAAQNAVMSSVGAGDLGKASGAYTTVRQLGGVFGLAIVVAVFAGAGSYASAAAFGDGFAPAIAVSAAFSLAGAVTALGIPGRGAAKDAAALTAPAAVPAEAIG